MKKAAILFSGCGYLDGAEIRESVLTLLELEYNSIEYQIFAPNSPQYHVINHLTGNNVSEERNILNEAARIARGNVEALEKLNAQDFDCLIIPGGFGVAKNFSSIAFDGSNAQVAPEIENVVNNFLEQKKPIGAICIAPALIAKILQRKSTIAKLSLGAHNPLLKQMGAEEVICKASEISYDSISNIVCTPAYMTDESLPSIHEGIRKLVKKIGEII